ncbi:protein FAM72A-like [Mizuhopecten yessoensis]|uniref:Protein FAM72A n=1 Tax=Mizuhopecten yessoensis TaxID=6573 RepID=A0A210QKW0_MIZYE|nr:protein FAM72A-like [Mizuhopecten yessoensis]OWF49383.1 Protein FAM72A [Mizuhopecten yessoensis]
MSDNAQKVDNVAPSFRRKQVFILDCAYCDSTICRRAMRAVLLADSQTELFSTDIQEEGAVDMTDEKFYTDNCDCLIEHMACTACGNVVGYHIRMPCIKCIKSCNNGHMWMFYRHAITPKDRLNTQGEKVMVWGDIPTEHHDHAAGMLQDECCR